MKLASCTSGLIVLFGALLPVMAQEPGVVQGTVEDPSGILVPQAAVKLTPQTDGDALKTVTDEKGHFAFTEVPPGDYLLRVKMQGFEAVQLDLKVGSESIPPQKVRLELSNRKEEITTSARVSDPLSSDQNATGDVLEHDMLKALPTKNDDPLAIAELFIDPVANDAEGTKIVVDGVEADTLDVPRDTVKSLAVNKNPYSTEFGRPGKGRIDVITRAGSLLRLHKRFDFAIRDASLDARNHFAIVVPPRRREWFEGDLDGPLFGGKATFFLGADLLRDNDNEFVNAILPSGPFSDTAPIARRTYHVSGRTDIRLSQFNVLSMRYNQSYDRWPNQGVSGFDLPSRGFTSDKRTQELRVSDIMTPSPHFSNELVLDLRLRPKLYFSATDATATLVNGAFNAGGAQISRTDKEKDVEFQDLLAYYTRKHAIRFGTVVKSRFIDYIDSSNFGGTLTYADLNSFEEQQPILYTLTRGNPRVRFSQTEAAYFFQDEMRLLPRLSLLVGFRHELQSDLSDYHNLAPRIASSTSTADGRTIVRLGSGIFYQRQPVGLTEQYLLNDGFHLQQFVITNPGSSSPASLPNSPPSVYRLDPNIRTPYAIQASLSVEHKVGQRAVATAEYTHFRGVKLYRMRDLNAPLPTTGVRPNPNFVNIGQFESSGSTDHNSLTLGFRTSIRRLQLFSRYTFSHSLDDTNGMTYLPADNFDLRAERARSDFDQRHRLVIGSVLKLPHGFNFGLLSTVRSGIPYNITTGFDNNNDTVVNDRPTLNNSAAPFNSFGVDGRFVGGTPGVVYNGPPAVQNGLLQSVNANTVHWLVLPGAGNVGRNTGIGPAWADMDVRFVKKFIFRKAADKTETTRELEFRADIFDLLNHTNYLTYVGTLNSPDFALPIDAYPSRELQLGIRVSF